MGEDRENGEGSSSKEAGQEGPCEEGHHQEEDGEEGPSKEDGEASEEGHSEEEARSEEGHSEEEARSEEGHSKEGNSQEARSQVDLWSSCDDQHTRRQRLLGDGLSSFLNVSCCALLIFSTWIQSFMLDGYVAAHIRFNVYLSHKTPRTATFVTTPEKSTIKIKGRKKKKKGGKKKKKKKKKS